MREIRPEPVSPRQLTLRLAVYFFVLLAAIIAMTQFWPEVFRYLPFGGRDALEGASGSSKSELLRSVSGYTPSAVEANNLDSVETVIAFVVGHLTGTVLLMLPITWTYTAVNYEAGFRKNFVRSLIILPLCATTTVLLIQDSLALAFGLAALVAAVRFRVTLDDAMDGIFIFAAVCVGLAAGIGYLGVALMMSMFFCFSSVVMWALDYGQNPGDAARLNRKRAKQKRSAVESSEHVQF